MLFSPSPERRGSCAPGRFAMTMGPSLADLLCSSIRALHFALESIERLRPELIEPAPQGAEPIRIDVIHPARALRSIAHQAGLLQGLEMLRDCRTADGYTRCNRAHGAGTRPQGLENRAPCGVGERGEC